ncbi:hypothetical protein LTR09_003772 [Extremus antarcticus]|uniref:F-box domain-containing protein n=1 Tax=Extremus antarcticus TaxID=702011 RepID=A0AAJ0DJC8_9PEZI|nr:hypothetical protein LTR09_003772 [Extremus antarcticus]
MVDALNSLPAELVLQILDFAPVSHIAGLLRLNKAWNSFINTHQDAVYASTTKVWRPPDSRDLAFLSKTQSFAKYFEGTSSWKELCKRQTLLTRAWNRRDPITRESIIQVGNDAVWRFRVDFERRFVLSTSQQGGLNVTDLDSGDLLWRLSNSEVWPFAHLEYQDGKAVWDREGNAVEVWQTDIEGLPRGNFRQVAILPHEHQTRGFQVSYNILCVVSTEGICYVYDMAHVPPRLKSKIAIEEDAVGHLDQNEDVVMVSMGKNGYHFYDKITGARVGILDPRMSLQFHHIHHPPPEANSTVSAENAFYSLPSIDVFPPRRPSKDRLTPIRVAGGPLHRAENEAYTKLGDDDWGAALFSGSMMAAISRGGRLLVCLDWRTCLQKPKFFERLSYIIECRSDGSGFDLGGWLSFRNNRVMFEVQDRVYVVTLRDYGTVDDIEPCGHRPSYAFTTSSVPQLAVPVSFMALFDDCILSTYTTLGWRRRTAERDVEDAGQTNRFRIFPTKTIRILSLAPNLEPGSVSDDGELATTLYAAEDDRHTNILEIMDMLSADEEDTDDDIVETDADGSW